MNKVALLACSNNFAFSLKSPKIFNTKILIWYRNESHSEIFNTECQLRITGDFPKKAERNFYGTS
jgi:hypothetical protein